MAINQELLESLKQMLGWKKSKSVYASKLGVTLDELEELLLELRKQEKQDTLEELDQFERKVNIEKGTIESDVIVDFEPKTIEELAKLHKIDLTKYKISTYWSKLKSNGKFTSSILASLIKEEKEVFQSNFVSFLKEYKPACCAKIKSVTKDLSKANISLILPKQDAHFNKFDIGGKNDIEDRFRENDKSIWKILQKTALNNNISEIIYIVGSDQFNSEWTSLTTKGTPQQNILSYQDSFKAICDHEIGIIHNLLEFGNTVKIIFIPGNHDEFVGWHLINLLETYFRNEVNISFDSSTLNTKYHKFGNTAIMLNHGDAIKPKELAQKFPIGFKEKWSECDNYIIITGDKHHELSLDIHGIKFYQLPQLSSAVSKWDDKQGYIDNKAEMTAFVITETNGISDIYKEIL